MVEVKSQTNVAQLSVTTNDGLLILQYVEIHLPQ